MKRMIALAAAAAMICSMPVMAATSPSAAAVMASVAQEAASEGKSVGEYTNNAVVEVPGLDEVTPIAQGGHVIINGAPSNVVFFLTKPSAKTVTLARNQADALGGKVLNVVGTKSQAVGKFETAQVNFYAKGVRTGQLIKVYQLIDGEWVELEIAEIRDDHVVVNMTAHGILAFIEVPEAENAEEPKTEAAEVTKAENAEEPKTEAAEVMKAESVEKPKAESVSEPKAEAADKSKAKTAEVTKTEATEEPESETAKKSEAGTAEEPAKEAVKASK